MADNANPHITVEDLQGKPQSGAYISHKKNGRMLATVVLERANGSRFQVITTALDIEDALAVAQK